MIENPEMKWKIKFEPRGDVPLIQQVTLKRAYFEHVKKILDAPKKVDNYAPKLGAGINVGEDRNRLLLIDKANKTMLEDINKIGIQGGVVDCHLHIDTSRDLRGFLNRKMVNKKIEKENFSMYSRIISAVPYYKRDELLAQWRRNKMSIEGMCQFPLLWKGKPPEDILLKIGPRTRSAAPLEEIIPRPIVPYKIRPRCFFDVKIANDRVLGRLEFELYGEYVPKTAANFLSLCKGNENLTYKGCPFHRIIPGLMCQGGDITDFNGSGGMTIYGEIFNKENFKLRHGGAGVLAMTSIFPRKNSSQFNISFRDLHTLDGTCVVFGKVVKGIDTLIQIEQLGARSGKPMRKVIISDCGQL